MSRLGCGRWNTARAIEGNSDSASGSLVDVSCSDFEQTFDIATAKIGGRRFRENASQGLLVALARREVISDLDIKKPAQ
jgi:hypothetical protein